MLCKSVLQAIGQTPTIRLERLLPELHFQLFGKLEALNPGGSIKDRSAMTMLQAAIHTGAVRDGTTIIESSSGNLAIGLAQACAYLDLKFICVVDAKTTEQNIGVLRAYGACIEMISVPDPVTGEFLSARIERVKELLRRVRNSYWPNQYANLNNARAQQEMFREVCEDMETPIHYVFCSTSTCGTIRGCSDHILANGLTTRIVAVDAIGSTIFGGVPGKRLIPGHGAAITSELLDGAVVHAIAKVSDLDCVIGCRRLAKREGLFCGGSSGGVLRAIESMAHLIPEHAACVAILPDRGERYLDTIYSDAWVERHFGDVFHHWEFTNAVG